MIDDDRLQIHAEWDDELDAAERAALDARVAADPELARYREEMRALRGDLRALGDDVPTAPPLDFDALAESAPPSGVGLPWWLAATAAAAAALLIALGISGSRDSAPDAYEEALTAAAPEVAAFPSNQPARPADPGSVAFRMEAPAARTVAVAGDFNGWKPEALTMKRGPDGAWVARAALPPGRYAYMYVVDGDWTTPPDAARTQDDGFGSRNAVIDVL